MTSFDSCGLGRWMNLPARSDEVGKLGGGCGTHAREQVLVGVHGESGVGVAEAFGNDLDRHSICDEQRRMRVAKIVEPDSGQTGLDT